MNKPANNNHPGPFCGPEHARMSAELADLRKILGMPEPRWEGREVVASSGVRTAIPMRKFTSEIGGDDE